MRPVSIYNFAPPLTHRHNYPHLDLSNVLLTSRSHVPLILNPNHIILLLPRHDCILFLALERGELAQGALDDTQGGVDLLLGDDEGRGQPDDVPVGRFSLVDLSE